MTKDETTTEVPEVEQPLHVGGWPVFLGEDREEEITREKKETDGHDR